MVRPTDDAAKPKNDENEDVRPDGPAGKPPRPANEPKGSEGSSDSGKTLTDPATGSTD